MSKPIILCVDDEKIILDSLKIQLRNEFKDNYSYETAESADEALELLEELTDEQVEIIAIVSDWLMPGIKGDEFLIEVHQKFPKVVKIMLTGQANEEAVQRAFVEANLHQCLAKPWHSAELIASIRSGLKKIDG